MDYLIAAGLIAAMTSTPLPLPPTWLILAALSASLDANAAGIVVAGALGAAAGRTILALWTRALGPHLLRPAARANLDYLAARLHGPRGTLGAAAVLAVSPPPAGALYTAAGLLRINLAVVAAACFCGRLVTYGIGVASAQALAGDLGDRVRQGLGPIPIALGLLLLGAALFLLLRLDWREAIERRRLRLRLRQQGPQEEADAPQRQGDDAEHQAGHRKAAPADAPVGRADVVHGQQAEPDRGR